MALSCDAVIFDLDGVLIDSEAAIEKRWRQWAEQRNIPFDEVAALYHGRPMTEVIEAVAPHLDADAETAQMSDMLTAAPEALRPFEGAEALLNRLPAHQWTIATSGRRRTSTNRLVHVGLPIPEHMVTADDVAEGKPAPNAYQLAAERLGVAPDRCVVFEDAPAGVEAARTAGAKVVGVTTTTDADALSEADLIVPNLAAVTIESVPDGTLTVRPAEA